MLARMLAISPVTIEKLRPESPDISTGSWSQSSGTSDFWTYLDEVTPDHNDYVTTGTASDTFEVSLQAPSGTPTGYLRLRFYARVATTGPPDTLNEDGTIKLMDGTTEVSSHAFSGGTDSWDLSVFTPTAPSSYSDLRIRVTSDSALGNDDQQCSWIELEVHTT